MRSNWLGAITCAGLLFQLGTASAQENWISPPVATSGITAPANAFPQEPGTDYYLSDYSDYVAYLETLSGQSDRIKLVDIGQTAEGRTQWMAIVSSPENLAKLDDYQTIARQMAKAEGLSDDRARALAEQGKAVVWIDAGLHATETVTTQGQIHVLYRMLSQSDSETLRILDNVIILFGQANPDGMDLVSNWYMRNEDPEKREFGSLPRLYQKYVGHDNNRDFFMSQMPETENINRVLFREWFPQIIYNQHQTGPSGQVVFVPPFRDPFNYNYDPLVITELGEVGAAMHSRLISENKPGSSMRSAASYSTWHNGMLRSVSYFHNAVGLLTEIIGGPTPERIPLVPEKQLAQNDAPLPIAPQMWHLSDTVEYQWTMNRAVLDYAARNRERLLFNIYRMGANNIARGSKDSWTITPERIAELEKQAGKGPAPVEDGFTSRSLYNGSRVSSEFYDEILHDPAHRDPRGFIIPADQPDMPTAITFLNALIKTGVDVEKADKAFTVAGKSYPSGSYVVKADQAYRPHLIDMFEPQDHPHDLEYPGGPPKAPYDITGYTLAFQMGVKFDRILDGFDGPFSGVEGLIKVPEGDITGGGSAGWLVSHATNNSFILSNRLLAAGHEVSWVTEPLKVGSASYAPGALWIPREDGVADIIDKATSDLGIDALAQARAPSDDVITLKRPRIGLVDRYGGDMASGWTRWILEQFEFPFEVVFPKELDAGDLNDTYDALIFVGATGPEDETGLYSSRSYGGNQPIAEEIPAEYRDSLGQVSIDRTAVEISEFVRKGGTLITIGQSNYLTELIGVRVDAALVDNKGAKGPKRLSQTDFFIPGTIVEARVDNTKPLAFGVPETVDMFFARSQTFVTTGPGAETIAWFDTEKPLRSGWAVGQEKLKDTIAIVDADLGDGKVFMMGPEVTQRAQPYGTFKFLFNGLQYGPAITSQDR